jgi:phage I-like protein
MSDTNDTTTSNEDTAGLKAKVTEIMGKLTTAKKQNSDLETRLSTLEQERDDALSNTTSEVDREKNKLQREIDKLTKANDGLSQQLKTLTIDNVIAKAMTDHGVFPDAVPMLEAFLRSGAEIKDGVAVKGDTTLDEAVSSYFASDAAKRFIPAPVNTGAGATGSSTAAKSHGFTKENFKDRQMEWAMMEKTDPAAFRQIAIDTGNTNLLS